MFKNKILLITGGTGSFGNKVLERFLDTEIKEIRVLSRDEKKQDDMRRKYRNAKIKFYIGDVRDYGSIEDSFLNVDYVFHAAALKQVPSCEFFPIEAVKTNILGTENVIKAAVKANVDRVICLSTDKAAYPVNAMGISKALMEKVFIAKSRTTETTVITGTRYGNVLYSRGSVVPLFIEQIKKGIPITVTNPNMTRFIMTLDDAMDLVIFAYENANPGDIFIQKSPSCRIGDLAIAIKELFDANNEIQIIGERHGEKLYEVLMTKEEASKSQEYQYYYKIMSDNRDLNYNKYLVEGHDISNKYEEYNSHNTKILTINEIKNKLLEVPEFKEELDKWLND